MHLPRGLMRPISGRNRRKPASSCSLHRSGEEHCFRFLRSRLGNEASILSRARRKRCFCVFRAWLEAYFQNLSLSSTQALRGAPGVKNVALCTG